MIALLLLVSSPTAAASDLQREAFYVDASIDVDGRLLDWHFVELDPARGEELVLAVAPPRGDRELRIHPMRDGRPAPEPRQVVPMLKDIVAWGVADVRDEPGRELCLMTSQGVWSYSLQYGGYKDNARPLVSTPLLYDFADPGSLSHWRYVLPGGERDRLLVPEPEQIGLWGPGGEDGAYRRVVALERPPRKEAEDTERPSDGAEVEADGDGFEILLRQSSLFLQDDPRAEAALFSSAYRFPAPALVDLEGDGHLDLIRKAGDRLFVHRGGPAGPAAEPTRIEAFPDDLVSDDDDVDVDLRLVDLDGDSDLDVLAEVSVDVDDFENAVQRVLVYENDGRSLLQEKPAQVLRFEAAFLVVDVADVDGDGRVDLAVRKLELPSLVGTVTGLEFTFSHLVYLGERRGFARKPALKRVEVYDEDSIVEVAANRELVLDCDGDGIADLVEIDVDGRIAVRRLKKESSFFGGTSWELEESPWKRFDSAGEIGSLTVRDFNGDGLGDIVSAGEQRLTLFVSARRSRR